MPYFKVSLDNVIIEAKNETDARIGFANYIASDCGISNFTVEQLTKKGSVKVDYTESK